MGEFITQKIQDLTQYIEFVTTFLGENNSPNNATVLYRGQINSEWELLPSIGRSTLPDDFLEHEKAVLNEFCRLGRPYLDHENLQNPWDLISIAQHHGLYTRLLDWTTNPLVALWFAFHEDSKHATEDRVIWLLILDKTEIVDSRKGSPFKQDKTMAFKPNHLTQRVIAQSGWFTSHKYIEKQNRFISLHKMPHYSHKLARVLISAKEKNKIIKSLDLLGINYFSLFPNLDGLAKYLCITI